MKSGPKVGEFAQVTEVLGQGEVVHRRHQGNDFVLDSPQESFELPDRIVRRIVFDWDQFGGQLQLILYCCDDSWRAL